jgi:hypothetical protein
MSQIILIKGSFLEQSKLETYIESELGLNVIVKDNIKEGLSLVEILPNSAGIIMPEEDLNKNNAYKFLEDFSKNNKISTQIFLSSTKVENRNKSLQVDYHDKHIKTMSRSLSADRVIREMKMTFALDMRKKTKDFFFHVPIRLIENLLVNERFDSLPFNLSIGINASETHKQYIMRFRKNEVIDFSDFYRFKNQGVKNFYISYDEEGLFLDFIQALNARRQDTTLSPFDTRVQMGEINQAVLRLKLISNGINIETSRMMDDYFYTSYRLLKNEGAFKDLISNFMLNKTSFQYGHSLLLSIVLHRVSLKLGWDSDKFKEKVTFISIMHDLLLSEDEMASSTNEEDYLKISGHDDEKLMSLKHHAQRMAMMIENYPGSPMGSEEIIREHHGVKNGIGFSTNLNYDLHHLSMVFIVCEAFVHELLNTESINRNSIRMSLEKMSKIYNKNFYKKALDSLELIFT